MIEGSSKWFGTRHTIQPIIVAGLLCASVFGLPVRAARVDPEFSPLISSGVSAIAVQSDGQIVVGGSFTSVNI